MAFMQISFYSKTLNMVTNMVAIIPEQTYGVGINSNVKKDMVEWPVLYLLHGGSDDSSKWWRYTSIERYVTEKNIAVIMPEVGQSGYVNMKYGPDYFSFISEEVPEMAHDIFRLSNRREKTAICGVSMGGNGALKVGLKYPDKFSAIGVFSAGNKIAEKEFTTAQVPQEGIDYRRKRNIWIYGTNDLNTLIGNPEYDVFEMAKKAIDSGKPLPKIFSVLGLEDHNYEGVQMTRKYFESLPGNPFQFEYHESPGKHEWKFWDFWIQKFLDKLF